MSDPATSTPPPAAPPPPSAPPAAPSPGPLAGMVESMGMPQLLVVGGAALLILADLVFGILIDEFYLGALVWAAAAIIVVAFLIQRMRNAPPLPGGYRNILLVGALVIALVGGRDVVIDVIWVLRSPSSWGTVELLALAVMAIGVVAVAVGGWQLWRGGRVAQG